MYLRAGPLPRKNDVLALYAQRQKGKTSQNEKPHNNE